MGGGRGLLGRAGGERPVDRDLVRAELAERAAAAPALEVELRQLPGRPGLGWGPRSGGPSRSASQTSSTLTPSYG